MRRASSSFLMYITSSRRTVVMWWATRSWRLGGCSESLCIPARQTASTDLSPLLPLTTFRIPLTGFSSWMAFLCSGNDTSSDRRAIDAAPNALLAPLVASTRPESAPGDLATAEATNSRPARDARLQQAAAATSGLWDSRA